MKPIKVWGHWGGPNPWKVYIILKELDLVYEDHVVEFSETRKQPYLKLNPVGKLPTIEDPNTGVRLWETGAIILYLIDQYDNDGKISYREFPRNYDCIKWLMFQVSGQGPYFGQLTWFARFHVEKIPSAIDRYVNEIDHVFGVLDEGLKDQGWLVGDKCTYADLSFVTWCYVTKGLLKQIDRADLLTRYPRYARWLEAMESREVVRDCLETITAERAAHGLPP